jgi:hypothetical protein
MKTTITIFTLCILTTSCGLITPKCTAKDHSWPKWQQRARTDVWGDITLQRKCKNCGWIDARKTNPCGL